jgi:hypothetical protein
MNGDTDNSRDEKLLQSTPAKNLPQWHRPQLSKVSIAMTLFFNGSPVDGSSGSSSM